MKLALTLDPLTPLTHVRLGHVYYNVRQYDLAIDHLQKTLEEISPDDSWAHSVLGRAYLQIGMTAEAVAAFRAAYATSGGRQSMKCFMAHAHILEGQREDAARLVEELQEQENVWPTQVAMACLALGQMDSALDWLERGYQERDAWMSYIKADAMVDSLRSHPRFQDLLRRMNFPD
jgi:serine/threonine-protein kinase